MALVASLGKLYALRMVLSSPSVPDSSWLPLPFLGANFNHYTGVRVAGFLISSFSVGKGKEREGRGVRVLAGKLRWVQLETNEDIRSSI